MSLSADQLDEINRETIIDEFVDEHGLVLTDTQKSALMKLIKDSADWGRKVERERIKKGLRASGLT